MTATVRRKGPYIIISERCEELCVGGSWGLNPDMANISTYLYEVKNNMQRFTTGTGKNHSGIFMSGAKNCAAGGSLVSYLDIKNYINLQFYVLM